MSSTVRSLARVARACRPCSPRGTPLPRAASPSSPLSTSRSLRPPVFRLGIAQVVRADAQVPQAQLQADTRFVSEDHEAGQRVVFLTAAAFDADAPGPRLAEVLARVASGEVCSVMLPRECVPKLLGRVPGARAHVDSVEAGEAAPPLVGAAACDAAPATGASAAGGALAELAGLAAWQPGGGVPAALTQQVKNMPATTLGELATALRRRAAVRNVAAVTMGAGSGSASDELAGQAAGDDAGGADGDHIVPQRVPLLPGRGVPLADYLISRSHGEAGAGANGIGDAASATAGRGAARGGKLPAAAAASEAAAAAAALFDAAARGDVPALRGLLQGQLSPRLRGALRYTDADAGSLPAAIVADAGGTAGAGRTGEPARSRAATASDVRAHHLDHGGTPLHVFVASAAAQDADTAAAGIELLQVCGADVNAPAANGSTPLHWAAGSGSLAAVQALLSRGADARAVTYTWRRHAFGHSSGQTALHWAAESGHTAIVTALAETAADAAVLPDERGKTPRDLALRGLSFDTADVLASVEATPYVCLRLRLESAAQGILPVALRERGDADVADVSVQQLAGARDGRAAERGAGELASEAERDGGVKVADRMA